MIRPITLASLVGLGLLTAGCNPESMSQRTLGGALIGAGSGALIGVATGGGGPGAAIGAGVGAVSGGVLGAVTTPNNCLYQTVDGRRYAGPCP